MVHYGPWLPARHVQHCRRECFIRFAMARVDHVSDIWPFHCGSTVPTKPQNPAIRPWSWLCEFVRTCDMPSWASCGALKVAIGELKMPPQGILTRFWSICWRFFCLSLLLVISQLHLALFLVFLCGRMFQEHVFA